MCVSNETICFYALFSLYLQVCCLSLALAILKHEKTRKLWIACKAYPFVSVQVLKNKARCIYNPSVYTLIPSSIVRFVTIL